MASITLAPDQRFPPGTVLTLYAATPGARPVGASLGTSTVDADSTVTFTGLTAAQRYVAGVTATGPFVSFQIDADMAGAVLVQIDEPTNVPVNTLWVEIDDADPPNIVAVHVAVA